MMWQTGVQMLMTKRPPPIGVDPVTNKKQRPSRAVTDMSRAEICRMAAQINSDRRRAKREALKAQLVEACGEFITTTDLAEQFGVGKTYVRDLLYEALEVGLVERTKQKHKNDPMLYRRVR